jgi:protein arginine kinase activator
MYCDTCGKKPAIIHYSQTINEKTIEMHLCEECALKKGLNIPKHFSFPDLLAGITDVENVFGKNKKQELKCEVCGLTFSNFREIGRLGCVNCYKAFEKPLKDLIKRIHGSDKHLGKIPEFIDKKVTIDKQIEELKILLQKAVEAEEYEKAAEYRDEIKKINKK